MALEDILDRIREDAEAEAREILAAARAEQDRILQSARGQAASTVERILALGRSVAQDVHRKELATAGVEVRRILLQSKQQVLEGVFEAALQRLTGMPDAEYAELLKRLALRATVTGTEQVLVSAADRRRLGPAWLDDVNAALRANSVAGELEFADYDAPIRGGLVLRAVDMEINCSFERTLASLRDQLEPEVAALLFTSASQETAE